MTGVDPSAKMLELARQRVGAGAAPAPGRPGQWSPAADYFTPREYSEEYTFSGQSTVLTFWHRPLHAMTAAFTEAGFRIAVISEPPTAAGARERFPGVFAEVFRDPSGTTFLCFLFFVLESA